MEKELRDAQSDLWEVVSLTQRDPVFLTRENQRVAAVINVDTFQRLLDDSEELADIRAVEEAWEETRRRGESPLPLSEGVREIYR